MERPSAGAQGLRPASEDWSVFMQQRPLSTVLMLRDRLCQRCFCPHEAALGHPCAWRPGQAHSWTRAVAELGNGGAPSRGWRHSRFMALGGERTEKRTLRTPLTETDGRTLATDAGERVLGEAPDHTACLTLQCGPPPGGGGGALRLKPLSYDRRAEARVTGLSPVVSQALSAVMSEWGAAEQRGWGSPLTPWSLGDREAPERSLSVSGGHGGRALPAAQPGEHRFPPPRATGRALGASRLETGAGPSHRRPRRLPTTHWATVCIRGVPCAPSLIVPLERPTPASRCRPCFRASLSHSVGTRSGVGAGRRGCRRALAGSPQSCD